MASSFASTPSSSAVLASWLLRRTRYAPASASTTSDPFRSMISAACCSSDICSSASDAAIRPGVGGTGSCFKGFPPLNFDQCYGRSQLHLPRPRGVAKACTRRSFSSRHKSSPSRPSTSEVDTFRVAAISEDGTLSMKALKISEILRNSSLHGRDLFSLSLTSSHNAVAASPSGVAEGGRLKAKQKRIPSAILPRGSEIVLSFGNIRALIGRNTGMIFDADNPGTQLIAEELAGSIERHREELSQDDLEPDHEEELSSSPRYKRIDSFEMVLIEEILKGTCATFNRRLRLYEPIMDTLLLRVDNAVFSDAGVRHLIPLKESLQEFEMNVESCLKCLTHLLEKEEDMLGLLLTERHEAIIKGESLDRSLHESVELLLEEYARQVNNVINEINFMNKRLQSKQELVALSLDSYRNRILTMNVYLAIIGISFSSATTIAGVFGMNLISGLEESPVAFNSVVAMMSIVCVLVFLSCASYISGASLHREALERIREIETITGALSNLQSVDYAVKTLVDADRPMSRDEFTRRLFECRPNSPLNVREINMLFQVFDQSKDGYLYTDDFPSIESFRPGNRRIAPNDKERRGMHENSTNKT